MLYNLTIDLTAAQLASFKAPAVNGTLYRVSLTGLTQTQRDTFIKRLGGYYSNRTQLVTDLKAEAALLAKDIADLEALP